MKRDLSCHTGRCLGLVLATLCCVFGFQLSAQVATDIIFDRSANSAFAYGADISWLSIQESMGNVFRDKNGVEKDLLVILKEQGVNAVRLRVWVNPEGGWHGKQDVIKLSERAHALGFRIMINFHYSDSWADPAKQYKPAAWENYSFDQLKEAVYDHTYDVLEGLQQSGITPAWVQVGNETRRGMLWPDGHTDNGFGNFTQLLNAGYDAVKAIDSSILVINHVDNGHDNSLYRWMHDGLANSGAKYDIIGMSAYPRWSKLDGPTLISRVIDNLNDMKSRYSKEVMVVESGHYWHEPYVANNYLVELMKALIDEGGTGNFYWEPQYYGGWYEMGAWNPNTQRPTVAMDAYLGIKHHNPSIYATIEMVSPTSESHFTLEESIVLVANLELPENVTGTVSFYLNDELVGETSTKPYTHTISNPGTGLHSVHASVTYGDNFVLSSEPSTILVGPIIVIQENATGFCGITDDAGSVDTNHLGFSGEGFINGDNVMGGTVNWAVDIIDAGDYEILFRYASSSSRPATVLVNGESIGTADFSATQSWSSWSLNTINYTVAQPGRKLISITALEDEGLPNIDYFSVVSKTESMVPQAASSCEVEEEEDVLQLPDVSVGQLKIYPVPVQHEMVITSGDEINSILIYQMDGVLVKTLNNIGNKQINIDVSSMKSGIYMVQIDCEGKFYSRRVHLKD